jgi:hypothetical protein
MDRVWTADTWMQLFYVRIEIRKCIIYYALALKALALANDMRVR